MYALLAVGWNGEAMRNDDRCSNSGGHISGL